MAEKCSLSLARELIWLQIMAVLEKNHEGRDHPITEEDLLSAVGMGSRQGSTLRRIIGDMVVFGKKPIGSCPRHPAGFFLICSDEDLAVSTRHLDSRVRKIGRRSAALKNMGWMDYAAQLELSWMKDK